MNCKYCNAELPEDVTLCPACGKEQEAEEMVSAEKEEEIIAAEPAAEETPMEESVTENPAESAIVEEGKPMPFATEDFDTSAQPVIPERPKATPGKIALAVIAGVLVLAILIGLLIGGMGSINNPLDSTIAPTGGMMPEATEEPVPVTIPSNGDPTSVLCKESYTVSDEEAMQARDIVVATMGDKKLTNGELQAYYWMEVSLFLQQYYSYAEFLGLDVYTPLDKQLSEAGEAPMSWQQYFLDYAITTWMTYQSMELEAEAAGYEIPAERQADLDSMPEELEESAKANGKTIDEMVRFNIGPGAKLEDYLNYVQTYYHGMSYYYDMCEKLDPTDAEIEAFFAENEAYYAENELTKETKYVDVRHVLLQPEGGEMGEDGYPVFTDEAWEECLKKVEEIYNKWQEGDKSEESFAALANENTQDGNDANGDGVPDGGLYENVYEGQMVPEFEEWCFDETRQNGDHGLVKTAYGYHIMFFCDSRAAWPIVARDDLINSISTDLIPETIEKHPCTVDYSAIVLGNIDIA